MAEPSHHHHTLAPILASYFFYKDSYFCIDNTCVLCSSLFITMNGETMLCCLLFLISLADITFHTILVLGNFQNSKDEPLSNIVGIALRRCGGSKNKPFCDGSYNTINFEDKKTERGKTTKIYNESIKYPLLCLNHFYMWVHITSSIVSLSV